MNESSRGKGSGDPPISGGFPPPPHPKEEFPTPPSSAQGQNTDTLQLGAFGQEDLDDLDNNLVGDGFALSRLLGGDSSSPNTNHWDTINESLATGQPTPPSNQSYENPSSVPSSNYDNEYQASQTSNNPGYRPWEAEQQQQQQQQQQQTSHYQSSGASTTVTTTASQQSVGRTGAPPPYYPHHYHQPHLPSFQSQFHFNENVPPPNTQAPAGPPVPRSPANSRYQTGNNSFSGELSTAQYPHIQAALSPNKFSGRVMVKARRGQASPQDQRPASASGGEAGHRSSVTPGPPGPHTTPSSPYSHGSDNTTQYLRMDNMISGDVRGKVRTASLEGSESDNSVRSVRSESDPGLADTPGQVAAISSTDPTPDTITGLAEAFKPPADISNNGSPGLNNLNHTNLSGGHQADTQEKPTKKKRKRCGECQGCQRKDNCGDCAPCRNEKSHQICKVRRCDRLTEKKPRKNGSFGGEFPGQMFPTTSPAGWGSSDWYGTGMGPPTGHSRTAAQLSFDNAYNFHGTGSHVMTSQPPVLQDFQLAQHHPFALSHHESPAPHGHSLGRTGNTRPAHTNTPTTLMYDPVYHPNPVNGQALPYHVSMTGGPAADKNGLLVASSRQPVTTVHHHQGNLQPGYLPRQVETSSLSCDDNQQNSTGYPGSLVTGPSSPLVTQDQRVTSSSRLSSKEPPPLPPPPLLSGLYQAHQQPTLTSPINQPTFLAFRAAEELVKEDDRIYLVNLKNNDLSPGVSPITETKLICSNPTSSRDQDYQAKSSTLPRTTAAPHLEDKKVCKQFKMSNSFVSISAKALRNSTSNNKIQSQSKTSIMTVPGREEPIEDFPRLDGNFELDTTDTADENKPPLMNLNIRNNETKDFDQKIKSGNTPREVLRTVLSDEKFLATISDDQEQQLRSREKLLEDVSPSCDCEADKDSNGPFYTQLGHAASQEELRNIFLRRLNITDQSKLRMEKIRLTKKEGVTKQGCPIAKWVIRRSSRQERYCIIIKNRYGHQCQYAWQAVCLIDYEGLSRDLADLAYEEIPGTVATYGEQTDRACQINRSGNCACQGINKKERGASYTFGCSYNFFNDLCKFCMSGDQARTFNLKKDKKKKGPEEEGLEDVCGKLSNSVASIFKMMAPSCYQNMTLFSDVASDCRIGSSTDRPFSGVTAVSDFCAHSHRDTNNMVGGCTVVVSLTRPENRDVKRPEEEQFHVLPLYQPDVTREEMEEKQETGGLEVLDKFRRTITVCETPKKPVCTRGKPSAEKKKLLDGRPAKKTNPKRNLTSEWEEAQNKKSKIKNKNHGKEIISGIHENNNSVLPSYGPPPLIKQDGPLPLIKPTLPRLLPQYSHLLPTSPVHPLLLSSQKQTEFTPPFSLQYPFQIPHQYFPHTVPQNLHLRHGVPLPLYDPHLGIQQIPSNNYSQNLITSIESRFCPDMLALLDMEEPVPQLDGAVEDEKTGENDMLRNLGPLAWARVPGNSGQENQLSSGSYGVQHTPEKGQEAPLNLSMSECVNNNNLPAELRSIVDCLVKEEPREEDGTEDRRVFESYVSDCVEAFQDVNMGGLALALPHGSVLVEVAKEELHATTALSRPNKYRPCRVGLVFYQHMKLHFPHHGHDVNQRKSAIREHRDYISWLQGHFVPTPHKLQRMKKAGYNFPEDVRTVEKRHEEATRDQQFSAEKFPGFRPGKYLDGVFRHISPETDTDYEVFREKRS